MLESTAPIVYVGRAAVGRMPAWGRFVAALIAGACLTVLIIASRLSPNPEGMGTHRALGLQGCGFLQRTGLPCPSCGMTTSFAWFVRGNLFASFYVQPMGAVLAALCGMCVWAGAYVAISGRPAYRMLAMIPSRYHVWPLLVLALAAWGWKMFIHLHGVDGW